MKEQGIIVEQEEEEQRPQFERQLPRGDFRQDYTR